MDIDHKKRFLPLSGKRNHSDSPGPGGLLRDHSGLIRTNTSRSQSESHSPRNGNYPARFKLLVKNIYDTRLLRRRPTKASSSGLGSAPVVHVSSIETPPSAQQLSALTSRCEPTVTGRRPSRRRESLQPPRAALGAAGSPNQVSSPFSVPGDHESTGSRRPRGLGRLNTIDSVASSEDKPSFLQRTISRTLSGKRV